MLGTNLRHIINKESKWDITNRSSKSLLGRNLRDEGSLLTT